MELEVKHIAPYLPYSLEMRHEPKDKNGEILYYKTGVLVKIQDNKKLKYARISIGFDDLNPIFEFKPILRPISDLKTDFFADKWESDIDVRTFLSDGYLSEMGVDDFDYLIDHKNIEWYPYGLIYILIKYHFDIFGLIENDLAIDINTLQ